MTRSAWRAVRRLRRGPPRVALREVGGPGDRAGQGGELTDLAAYVEGAGVGEPVQHRGHPVGEMLGLPHPSERPRGVVVERTLVTAADRALELLGQHLDVGQR